MISAVSVLPWQQTTFSQRQMSVQTSNNGQYGRIIFYSVILRCLLEDKSAARNYNRHLAVHRSPPPRGNFVPYDLLKLQYMRHTMIHVSPLAVGAFACNSHVKRYP